MRRKIAIAILLIVCFILQTTVFKVLAVAGISPNLLIIVTAAFGFMRGRKEGMFVGFFAGLLIDLFYGTYIGFYALIYMYIGYLNGFFNKIFYPEDVKLPMLLISLSDVFCNLVVFVLFFVMRGRFDLPFYFVHIMVPELIYTILVTIVLYFIILRINKHLEKLEKRSAAKFV
ncbi:MAG: rod shape-determining protein MreD [Lachnospiraceae bacterium]|nr:rod shape-determining protein MreD [Lachnospiraceae bacterium]